MDKTGNGNALDSKVTGAPTREPQKCKISERAIAVLGEEGVDAAGLIATLKRVRAQSIQPIGERLDVLPTIRRKGEEEARGRRGRCDEGITDKVPVGVRSRKVCRGCSACLKKQPHQPSAAWCLQMHQRRKRSRSTNCAPPSRICSAGGIGCDQRCPANAIDQGDLLSRGNRFNSLV